MRLSRHALIAVLALPALACGSDSGGPQTVTLSGTVRDYFTNTGLTGVTLAFSDQAPIIGTTSTAGGAYQFIDLLPNGDVTVFASLASYRSTRNERITWTTTSVTADQFAVASADAARQYTALGLTATAGTAIVIATLVNGAGQPHEGVPVADITLSAIGGGAPAGLGPFIFGATADVVSNATLSVTTAFGGRARVAFLDVPPGAYTLSVTFTSGTVQTKTVSVSTSANGVTLVRR